VIALVENNPRALQRNSAAVLRRFSDGNVPLNGQRKARPTIEELREYLDYEPETGVLRWRKPVGRVKAGAIVTRTDRDGYLMLRVRGISLRAHRVAFAMHHGNWPTPCCDHINGDPADNRAANLRESTRSSNQHNRRVSRNNTSGFKGVTRDRNLWKVQVGLQGTTHSKCFRRLEDAAAYAKQLREQLHGEFARH
jgi:hypothetical protein